MGIYLSPYVLRYGSNEYEDMSTFQDCHKLWWAYSCYLRLNNEEATTDNPCPENHHTVDRNKEYILCIMYYKTHNWLSLSPQYHHLISNWKLYLLVFSPYGEYTFPFRFTYFLWKKNIKLISNGSTQNPLFWILYQSLCILLL